MTKITKEEKKEYVFLKDRFSNVEESLLSSIWYNENFPSQINQALSLLLKSWQDFASLLSFIDEVNGNKKLNDTEVFDFNNLKSSVDDVLKKSLKSKDYKYFNDNFDRFISYKDSMFLNNEATASLKELFEKYAAILSSSLNYIINKIQKKYHYDLFSIFKRSLKWIFLLSLIILGYWYYQKALYYETYNFIEWKAFDSDWNTKVIRQDYGTLRINNSVDGNQCKIKDDIYKRCYGTHAYSKIQLDFSNEFDTFKGACGLDSECGGSIKCIITDKNNNELFRTDVLTRDNEAQNFNVSVKNLDGLFLIIEDANDGISCDHADWVNLQLNK